MKFCWILLLTGLALRAAEPAPIDLPEHFQPFVPLVGPVWEARFPGSQMTDTQEFEWVFEGKFLRSTHSVSQDGKVVYRGETIFAWDLQKKQIVWWYWNDTGGYLVGTLTRQEGSYLVEGVNNGPGGQTEKIRGEIVLAPDSWKSVQYFWKDETWKLQAVMEFKKKAG